MAEVSSVTAPMILKASSTVVTATFDSDPGSTTVSAVNLAGTEVLASTATGGTGTTRTVTLSGAVTADLDTLTLTWATANLGDLETTHEVIGRFLFSVSEARAFDNAAMTSTAKYSTDAIEAARARITDEFEAICGVSFVPRYARLVLNGSGLAVLTLPRQQVTDVRSIEVRTSGSATYTAYTIDELADVYVESWGELSRETLGTFTSGLRNVRVGFEHGYENLPLEIKRAALLALRYSLVESNISERAISISNDQGTTQLWTPGISGRGTAIHPLPEVDRILRLYMQRVPVIA